MDKILLLIPQNREETLEQGGQITAANGLIDYMKKQNIDFEVINTTPTIQERKYKILKVFATFKRVFQCYKILKKRDIKYMIMFKSGMLSLVERYLVSLICKKHGVKSSLFFRNSDILKIKLNSNSMKFKLLHYILDSFDILFVQGNRWKEHLNSFLIDEEKIHIIPNWIPPTIDCKREIKNIDEKDKVRFIFTGRVVKEKGVFEILEAIKLLNVYSNFETYIVGDGLDKEELEKKINESKLNNVFIIGWKSSQEVISILDDSHVFLLPSYQEGFPNSILEAMAKGLPIIATDVGAISESVFDNVNGYIVNKQSSIELSNAMKKYLDDVLLITKHSKKSLEIVQQRHSRDINCNYLFNTLK